MFYDKNILEFIELGLNNNAPNNLVFKGELGFYDNDWIKEHLGVPVTPFVLTDLGFTQTISGDYNGNYSIGILCRVKNRQDYYDTINDFFGNIKTNIQDFDGIKGSLMLSAFEIGDDFTSGSGDGEYYFEIMLRLNAKVFASGYSGIERTLRIDSVEIRHRGIKLEHGKMDLSNIPSTTSGTVDNINMVLNNGILVIEAYVDNTIVKDLLSLNKIGISKTIKIDFGDYTVLNNTMSYDGYLISNEQDNSLTAFLYFSLPSIKNTITIDGITVPFVSDGITMGVVTEPYKTPNSNIMSNVYVGKTRAYSFVVAETYKNEVQTFLNNLYAHLIGLNEEAPLFDAVITYPDRGSFTKKLLLTDIQKSSKDGGRGLITLQFVDGVDI